MRWHRLDFIDRVAGGPLDAHGGVEFEAFWLSPRDRGAQRERRFFAREGGRWVYVAGVNGGTPLS